jgi:thymidylate kinase
MSKKGLLIVIDGPSASGKNTIIKQLFIDLDKLNIKALLIEEAKEKDYDKEKILKARGEGDRQTAKTIIEERKKLYKTLIIPQLTLGTLIIANRGEPSTLGYQTINQELTMENVWNMHRQQQIPLPDLVVIANCNVKEAIHREKSREQILAEKNKNWLSGKFTSVRKEIHDNYVVLKNFLEKKGLAVIYLNTDTMTLSEESRMILNFIKNKINYLHE